MDSVVALGFLAAFCTTVAFLPQVVKALKTKSTTDISLLMYAVFTVGLFFWLLYGVFIDSHPIIAANLITLILSFSVIMAKLRYG